jgi:glycosyltransferase involved in cell wall biosynthesis
VVNRSLTIVLPVYNGESRLTGCVGQLLDLASELTSRFTILVVDDGSTDDTSAVARELTARYPQVSLRRNRQRRGLGPIVSMAQRRVTSDVVIVHDGVTPIDPVEVRRLWQQSFAAGATAGEPNCSVRELALVRATHDAMADAHGRVIGFHLLEPLRETASEIASPIVHSPSKPRPTDRSGVGQIPPLPRPNFLSAMAEFALGE